jgi:hypothetical protein
MPDCRAALGYGGNGATCSRIAANVICGALAGRPDVDADLYGFRRAKRQRVRISSDWRLRPIVRPRPATGRSRTRPRIPRIDLLLGAWNQSLALGFLARELARTTDRLGLFPVLALGGLLVGPPLLHFAKHAFALHLFLQHAKSLIDVVVANEYLQWTSFSLV